MVASQVVEAMVDQTTVDVSATGPAARQPHIKEDGAPRLASPVTIPYLLRATGSVVKFDGDKILPVLSEGEKLKLLQLLPGQHFTEPPARYTEASLIKKLEELGIGRPSTYAPIISTILERIYVEREERKFFPTPLGLAVADFLLKNFPDIFDYAFTAQMEDALDEVARGERAWQPTIKDFYTPFEKKLETVEEKADKVKIKEEVVDEKCPKCGKNLVVKFGKFGKFLACSGFPDCKYTASMDEKIDIPCPDCGGEIVVRRTKKGRIFYGCKNWPTCKFASWKKPGIDNNAQKL